MSKQTEQIQLPEREKNNEDYLTRQCNQRGWDCWKLTVPNRKGVPDRLVLAQKGVCALIEVKRQGGPIRALQARTITQLVDRGIRAYILESRQEIDSFLVFLQEEIDAV